MSSLERLALAMMLLEQPVMALAALMRASSR